VAIICALGPGNSFHEPSGSTDAHMPGTKGNRSRPVPRSQRSKFTSKMQLFSVAIMVLGQAFSKILSINDYQILEV
jgi:hypothetical protein